MACIVKQFGALFGPACLGNTCNVQILIQCRFAVKSHFTSFQGQHLFSHRPGLITKPSRQWHVITSKRESMLCNLETRGAFVMGKEFLRQCKSVLCRSKMLES